MGGCIHHHCAYRRGAVRPAGARHERSPRGWEGAHCVLFSEAREPCDSEPMVRPLLLVVHFNDLYILSPPPIIAKGWLISSTLFFFCISTQRTADDGVLVGEGWTTDVDAGERRRLGPQVLGHRKIRAKFAPSHLASDRRLRAPRDLLLHSVRPRPSSHPPRRPRLTLETRPLRSVTFLDFGCSLAGQRRRSLSSPTAACSSGAARPTATVVRPALWIDSEQTQGGCCSTCTPRSAYHGCPDRPQTRVRPRHSGTERLAPHAVARKQRRISPVSLLTYSLLPEPPGFGRLSFAATSTMWILPSLQSLERPVGVSTTTGKAVSAGSCALDDTWPEVLPFSVIPASQDCLFQTIRHPLFAM